MLPQHTDLQNLPHCRRRQQQTVQEEKKKEILSVRSFHVGFFNYLAFAADKIIQNKSTQIGDATPNIEECHLDTGDFQLRPKL